MTWNDNEAPRSRANDPRACVDHDELGTRMVFLTRSSFDTYSTSSIVLQNSHSTVQYDSQRKHHVTVLTGSTETPAL